MPMLLSAARRLSFTRTAPAFHSRNAHICRPTSRCASTTSSCPTSRLLPPTGKACAVFRRIFRPIFAASGKVWIGPAASQAVASVFLADKVLPFHTIHLTNHGGRSRQPCLPSHSPRPSRTRPNWRGSGMRHNPSDSRVMARSQSHIRDAGALCEFFSWLENQFQLRCSCVHVLRRDDITVMRLTSPRPRHPTSSSTSARASLLKCTRRPQSLTCV